MKDFGELSQVAFVLTMPRDTLNLTGMLLFIVTLFLSVHQVRLYSLVEFKFKYSADHMSGGTDVGRCMLVLHNFNLGIIVGLSL